MNHYAPAGCIALPRDALQETSACGVSQWCGSRLQLATSCTCCRHPRMLPACCPCSRATHRALAVRCHVVQRLPPLLRQAIGLGEMKLLQLAPCTQHQVTNTDVAPRLTPQPASPSTDQMCSCRPHMSFPGCVVFRSSCEAATASCSRPPSLSLPCAPWRLPCRPSPQTRRP